MSEDNRASLRILLLTNFFAPYMVASGIGELYRTLAEGLHDAGHTVTVIGVDIHGAGVVRCKWGELISLPLRPKCAFLPRSIYDAARIAVEVFRRRGSYDVVESPSYPGLLSIVGNPGLPRVARVISSVAVDTEVWQLRSIVYFILEWLTVARAAVVLCSTKFIERKSQRLYRIRYHHPLHVPLGIADVKSTPPVVDADRCMRFLVIAGATLRKGSDILIKAIGIAARRNPNFEVEIIGPGYARYDAFVAHRPELMESWTTAHDILHDRFRIRYDVDDSEKRRLIDATDYLLMTSRSESFGIPVIEAMRASRPVIASTGGALPEVAGASELNLFYDDPEDFNSLADLLVKTIHCGRADAIARGAAARDAYVKNFDCANFISRTVDGYREAIRLHPKRLKSRHEVDSVENLIDHKVVKRSTGTDT